MVGIHVQVDMYTERGGHGGDIIWGEYETLSGVYMVNIHMQVETYNLQ